MSFDQHQTSAREGGLITLYYFRVGEGPADAICYTDADEHVWFQPAGAVHGYRFKPIPIDRDEITDVGSLSKTDMNIKLPRATEIVRLFKSYPPSFVVTLQIFEGHFEDRDREFKPVWGGRLLNCEIEKSQATLSCQPGSTSLKRPGLRRNWQRQCPLPLYGPDCRAVEVLLDCVFDSATNNAITGIIPDGGLPSGAEAYANGIARWVNSVNGRNEVRSILSCVVNDDKFTILVSGAVRNVVGSFTITKGCQYTERTCTEWHNNILNYGGQNWIPLKNPVGTTSTYL